MKQKALDVFEEKPTRPKLIDQPDKLEKEAPCFDGNCFPFSRATERLARRPSGNKG